MNKIVVDGIENKKFLLRWKFKKYICIYNKLIFLYKKKKKKKKKRNYLYETFHSPPLINVDIIAKSSILIIGQYSVSKTTFIMYILESEFPDCQIGLESTTDSFMAIVGKNKDRIILGFQLLHLHIDYFK